MARHWLEVCHDDTDLCAPGSIDLFDNRSSTIDARRSRVANHSGDGRQSNVPADLAELDSICCLSFARLAGFHSAA